MAATKNQERKALEEIRKIVAELGEDSYICTAFEGCFEVAEENIENDFACSLKQVADKAQQDADYFKKAADSFSEELEKAQDQIRTLENTIEQMKAKSEESCQTSAKLWNDYRAEQDRADAAEQMIIQLKAKLYDLICS